MLRNEKLLKMRNDFLVLIIFTITLLVCVFTVRRWGVLRNQRYGKWRCRAERTVLSVISFCVLAVFASTAWNAFATHQYWAKHPVPGKIYTVNGHKMRIDCTGSGSPTLILDAGLGNDGLIWGKVQSELSKTTRVCSYDRAGFGWSDATSGPQDANHISDQLHGLLQQAAITGPIVLMGHSIAGLYIRAYASRYPHQVAGLIFVDGSTPLQQDRGPADLRAYENKTAKTEYLLLRLTVPLGLLRDLGQCSQAPQGLPTGSGRMLAEDNCEPHMAAVINEMDNFRQSGNETLHTGPYGDLPVLIFSQDPNGPRPSQVSANIWRELSLVWNEMQEDLKHLSTRSERIIAKGSSHYVQLDRADLLNREVPIFIEQIRRHAPEPSTYGVTKTE